MEEDDLINLDPEGFEGTNDEELEHCDEKIDEVNFGSFLVNEMNEFHPYMGMEFESQHDAYAFYNRYARKIGFSVQKQSTSLSRKDKKEVIGRTYCCTLEGKRDPRAKPYEEQKRKQSDTRTGCKAHMIIRKKKDKWIVTVIVEEHNHILVSPKKIHKLRSQRNISEGHKKIIDNIQLSGIKTNLAINFLGLESGGVQNIGFTVKDVKNYLSVKRSVELKNGDAQVVLDKLRTRHSSILFKLTRKGR